MTSPIAILIAEDEPVSQKLLEKTLTNAGYEVVSVENGLEALKAFDKNFYPIVLTDWVMPEMDGLELCRAIRASASAHSGYVFIILLTSRDSKGDIIKGLEGGADDYLTKPFDPAELIARLNTAKRILDLERSLKEANEEIRILSISDPLTKCYNRGYLNDHLPQEIKKARRYGHHLSLLLCDLDHFKKVNDTYGHLVGDRVLKEIVQSILHSIRNDVDWVARYGGEEFMVVLPETDIEGAMQLAERLCHNFYQKVIEMEGKEIRITASFGVTSFGPTTPDDKISHDALIRAADTFLYQAKQDGRNMVKGKAI